MGDVGGLGAWWRRCVRLPAGYHVDKRGLFAAAVLGTLPAGANAKLPTKLNIAISSDIPVGQGLGSSAATIAAGAALGQLLATGRTDLDRIFQATAELEGHPDNAAPAVYGGPRAVLGSRGRFAAWAMPWHRGLRVGLCVPLKQLKTDTAAARRALPRQVRHADAVDNQRALLTLLHGFATGDGVAIADGLADRLHVPYRKAMIPGFDEAVDAARRAGAFGATISGAGGSLVAFGKGNMMKAAIAMRDALRRHGVKAVAMTPTVSTTGLIADYRLRPAHSR